MTQYNQQNDHPGVLSSQNENQPMKRRIVLLAILAATLPGWAALPPLSPAVRKEMAEQVVTVTVESVTRKEVPGKAAGKDWLSTAVVKVDAVEKGPAKKGQTLTVHFRKTSTRPQGWVGPVDQKSTSGERRALPPLPDGQGQ